jgi:hypothetical protein
MRNAYKILVRRSEIRRPLGDYYIKMEVKEIGCENVDWIHLARDRVHGKDLRVLRKTETSLTS